MFFGFEHPLSWSKVNAGRLQTDISRVLPSQKNQFVTYSAVIGTAQAGQWRGAILAYLEDERPHAFEPFQHYNSWYDIGYENRYDEVAILDWQADRVGIGSLEAFEVHTFESDASAMHP
jgi:hypothetical protein